MLPPLAAPTPDGTYVLDSSLTPLTPLLVEATVEPEPASDASSSEP